jgi:hypothetical protein
MSECSWTGCKTVHNQSKVSSKVTVPPGNISFKRIAPLPMPGRRQKWCLQLLWREGSLSCHTCCDTGSLCRGIFLSCHTCYDTGPLWRESFYRVTDAVTRGLNHPKDNPIWPPLSQAVIRTFSNPEFGGLRKLDLENSTPSIYAHGRAYTKEILMRI